MLSRKLLLNLGPLILLLLATAIGVIWQLERVLANVRHIHETADVAVANIDDLGVSLNQAELELYRLEVGREQHLDGLIAAFASTERLLDTLGQHYMCRDAEGGPLFSAIAERFPGFRQHVLALSTSQNADLAKQHSQTATALALDIRVAILPLSQHVRDHARHEQEEVIGQFRRLVLALSIVFLVVINVAVIVLLRMAGMVLRPVEKLVQATRSLAMEKFDVRVDLDQTDEFGELAAAYNSMAERLENNEARRLEIISQIALTMNHELNNAMSIIELQLQMLVRRSDGSPAQEKCLRQIRSSLERMSQTVASLKRIRRVVLTDYLPGKKMIDLSRSIAVEEPNTVGEAPTAMHGPENN